MLTRCAALTAALCASAGFSNPRLDAARQKLAVLDYSGAAEELAAALSTPGNDRETLIDIYEQQGIIAGFLNRGPDADHAFRALLTLDPTHHLPGRQPPRVTTPFFEARSWVSEHGVLAMRREPPLEQDGAIAAVRVQVVDPLGLATGVRFIWLADDQAGDSLVALSDARASMAVRGHKVVWRAALVNGDGGVLLSLGGDRDPLIEVGRATPIPRLEPTAPVAAGPDAHPLGAAPAGRRRLWLPAVIVAAAGLIAVAVGGYFGWQSRADYQNLDAARQQMGVLDLPRPTALYLLQDGQQNGVRANVLFASGGGVALIGASVLVIDLLLGSGP